jgi:hypothetical protein
MTNTPDSNSDRKHVAETVARVKANLRVTKVVATRSVKTQKGDFFVGFSAAWDSVQDDHGNVPDMESEFSDSEVAVNGMTVEEARVAHLLLSMEASIAAWRAAHAEGVLSEQEFEARKANTKRGYAALLSSVLTNGGAGAPTPSK